MIECAECGKPIFPGEATYSRIGAAGDVAYTYHSDCRDPLGTKAAFLAAKNTEIWTLRVEIDKGEGVKTR